MIGLQNPAVVGPGVESQLLPAEQVPLLAQEPPPHTSCPRCA
jgi:hypothetical protein